MVGRPARDGGFTLIETIVVILLVAVLSSVVVAVVAVVSRNAPATETRVDNSRSYRGLITWLPRDAASTPAAGFVFGSATPVCQGATDGVSLVQMSWSPPDGTGDNYGADYRLVDSGGAKRIERHICVGIGGAPYPNTETSKATNELFDATATDSVVDGVRSVVITLKTCGPQDCSSEGPSMTVEAGSRNPAGTLP